MKPAFLLVAVVSVLSAPAVVSAQNWYQDYVVDECSQYSPDDPHYRGLIYRMQTGHAGFFANCDDDLEKMHSPYIAWRCRPSRPHRPLADFVDDCYRRSRRLVNGAGDCATGECVAQGGNQSCGKNCQCKKQQSGKQLAANNVTGTNSREKPVVNVAQREIVKQPVPPKQRLMSSKAIRPAQNHAGMPASVLIR